MRFKEINCADVCNFFIDSGKLAFTGLKELWKFTKIICNFGKDIKKYFSNNNNGLGDKNIKLIKAHALAFDKKLISDMQKSLDQILKTIDEDIENGDNKLDIYVNLSTAMKEHLAKYQENYANDNKGLNNLRQLTENLQKKLEKQVNSIDISNMTVNIQVDIMSIQNRLLKVLKK